MCGGKPSDVHQTEDPAQKLWVLSQMREKADEKQILERQGGVCYHANVLRYTTDSAGKLVLPSWEGPVHTGHCSRSHLGLRVFIPSEGAERVQRRRERQGHVLEGIINH